MTTEERILAYLDGSLSEEESAELMHQLSVSPENRVVLEQHIKLSELTRAAQRPYAVPEALEASLAERLPAILGASERAIPFTASRWSLTSLLSLVRIYPIRFAMGVVMVMVGSSAVYWYSQHANTRATNSSIAGPNSTAPSTTATPSPAEAPAAETKSMTDKRPSTESPPPIAASNNISNINGVANSSHPVMRSANGTKNHSPLSSTVSRAAQNIAHGASSHVVKSHIAHKVSALQNNAEHSLGENTIDERSVADHSVDVHTDQTIATPPSAIESSLMNIPPAEVRRVADGSGTIVSAADRSGFRSLAAIESHRSEAQHGPFAVRASFGMGETFLYVPTGNNTYTSRTESSPFVALDYSLSPEWTIGVEGGATLMLSLSPQSSAEASTDGTTHIVTHTTTTNSTEWFTTAEVRYCLNPLSVWQWELSLGAGTVVTHLMSPMATAQVGVSHPVSDALDVQAFVHYSGVWSKTSSTANTASAVQTSGPVAYKTADVASSTVFTPAITLRAGIQYRF